MPYIDNLQEFIGSVMIPFATIAAGAALAIMMLITMVATMINAFKE